MVKKKDDIPDCVSDEIENAKFELKSLELLNVGSNETADNSEE